MKERILGFVLAGGEGRRLRPLTRARCKPAVAFAGRFRIIDFVLSNFLNSGITSIHVLAQYLSGSLIDHLAATWRPEHLPPDARLALRPPRAIDGRGRYRGTADAIWQNLDLVGQERATLVAIFGSDHVYRMDIRQMVDFHRGHGGGVTLGAAPVPLAGARELGILRLDHAGRLCGYEEKPARPRAMEGGSENALASMGVWLVDPDRLVEALEAARAAQAGWAGESDWMMTPELFAAGGVHAYDLRHNRVPGIRSTEEQAYWRDVGTLPAFWSAHMDLLADPPHFDLENPEWPLCAGSHAGSSVVVRSDTVERSLLSEGADTADARVRRSVLGRGVWLGSGSDISESILMEGVVVGSGVRLERVIVDSPNSLPAGLDLRPGVVGSAARALPEGVFEDPSGLVVVPSATNWT